MSDDFNPYRPPSAEQDVLHHSATGESIISISRPGGFADLIREYRILVDGEERGQLKAGGTTEIPVSAAQHTVEARIDWCGSLPCHVTTRKGSTTFLNADSKLRGLWILFGFVYATVLRNRYLTLYEVPAASKRHHSSADS